MAKQVWRNYLNFMLTRIAYFQICYDDVIMISFINFMAQAVHRQMPLLVRTIGSSSDLLDIISDPPTGSEGLVIQVLFFMYLLLFWKYMCLIMIAHAIAFAGSAYTDRWNSSISRVSIYH